MIFYPTFAQAPNLETLTKELIAALAIDSAACGNANGFYVEVPDHITLEQVQTVVNAHNPATLTTAQQTRAEDTNARTTLLSLAESALTQIASDRAAIANGKTAAQAATTLAQMRTVIVGMLDVMDNTCNRQDREIRALRAIIRNGLGSG